MPTLVLICTVKDPITGKAYSRDPRYVAQKAEAFVKKSGVADTIFIGPEPEFYVFDDIRFDQSYNRGFYHIDSREGFWNTGREERKPNLGYKPRYKEGYFPVPPTDEPAQSAGEDVQGDDPGGNPRYPAPPRGGHGGTMRDRRPGGYADEDGGPRALVQVLRQEHGQEVGQGPRSEDKGPSASSPPSAGRST